MVRTGLIARASALALGLVLAGCGGGGGNLGPITSTPVPTPSPSPSPAPSYAPLSTVVTSSYSFPTAGVTYNASPASGFTNGVASALGNGVNIAYNASSDTFTVSAAGGPTQTFGSQNLQPSAQGTVSLIKTTGTVTDSLLISVPLTYAMVTVWNRNDTAAGTSTGRISVGGSPTLGSDVPKTGTAVYSLGVGGAARSNNTTYNLTSSSGTFNANFATGAIHTSLMLGGPPEAGGPVTNFGMFTGTATLAANTPSFSGAMSGPSNTGVFSGAFFGPQAAEVGFGWVLSGLGFSAAGVAVGVKQ